MGTVGTTALERARGLAKGACQCRRPFVLDHLNAVPLLAKITLLPDIVPPHADIEVRLEAATHVRAAVRCGDGTALQVQRWVWVIPPFPAADPALAGSC